MVQRWKIASHVFSVFCPSVPGSVGARSLGLSLEAKAKVKKYRHRYVREVMFRKLSRTRAAGAEESVPSLFKWRMLSVV